MSETAVTYHTVYLGNLKANQGYEALRWLAQEMPYSEGRWRIRDLCYVDFVSGADAMYFTLKWS